MVEEYHDVSLPWRHVCPPHFKGKFGLRQLQRFWSIWSLHDGAHFACSEDLQSWQLRFMQRRDFGQHEYGFLHCLVCWHFWQKLREFLGTQDWDKFRELPEKYLVYMSFKKDDIQLLQLINVLLIVFGLSSLPPPLPALANARLNAQMCIRVNNSTWKNIVSLNNFLYLDCIIEKTIFRILLPWCNQLLRIFNSNLVKMIKYTDRFQHQSCSFS